MNPVRHIRLLVRLFASRRGERIALLSLLFMLSLASLSVAQHGSSFTASLRHPSAPLPPFTLPPAERVAVRLQRRVKLLTRRQYSVEALMEGLSRRRDLLAKSVQVSWAADDGSTFEPWTFSPSAFSSWIQPSFDVAAIDYRVDPTMVALTFKDAQPNGIPSPVDSVITAVLDDHGVLRAQSDGLARPGYRVDAAQLGERIADAVSGSGGKIGVRVRQAQGRIVNATDLPIGTLEYWTTGRSNFAGSGDGRIANVRKGLGELINGILVPPGATFSFNAGVRDMKVAGWQDALAIVNGTDFVMTPGGGICQVATTVYRSALLAGLPITERANHSLFVSYYAKYGVGIDATVFPKKQDLTFVNDTDGYLLLQAHFEGFEAYVDIFGKPDGRTVALEGPYFADNQRESVTSVLGRSIKANEIVWLQHLTQHDGVQHTNVILSRYSSVPNFIRKEFARTEGGNT